jgi:uracil-DNA glycosylase
LCDCKYSITRLILEVTIEELNHQIYDCKKCRLWQGAKHSVPGEGPITAKVMFVGQNPGAEEDETGKPFVGRAGKYLTKVLATNGIKREDLFLTNIVKHKTPKNRKPFPDEIAACLPYLTKQINTINPHKIVLLGLSARETPRIEGITYFEIIHPSVAYRFPEAAKKFQKQIADLRKSCF